MTLTLDTTHTFQHTADPAMPFAPAPVADPNPLAHLVAQAAAVEAQLRAIAPVIVGALWGDLAVCTELVDLSRAVATIVTAAAMVGAATVPGDAQAEVFGALLDLITGDVTALIAAAGLDRADLDHLTLLTNGAQP